MDFLRFSFFYCQIRNVKSMSEYTVSVTSFVPWRGENDEQQCKSKRVPNPRCSCSDNVAI